MVLTTFDPFAEFDRITRRPGIRMDAIRARRGGRAAL